MIGLKKVVKSEIIFNFAITELFDKNITRFFSLNLIKDGRN